MKTLIKLCYYLLYLLEATACAFIIANCARNLNLW
jgi:hypothetical protein